jgi:hypothetical protein
MSADDNTELNARERGEIVFVTSLVGPQELTAWVRRVADRSGQLVDWHYDGARMVVRCRGDRAEAESAILALLPEHNTLFRAAQAARGVFYN